MISSSCGKSNEDTLTSRLNKRVSIRRPPTSDDVDAYGQPLDDWPEVTQLWAGAEPLQGQEFFAAKAENAEVTTRIRIRYRMDIDRTMIVRYGSIDFEILYIIHPKLAKRELQLMCKERQ
jgi:SPP1 family predicted phage head-tail adaptor